MVHLCLSKYKSTLALQSEAGQDSDYPMSQLQQMINKENMKENVLKHRETL